MHKYTVILLYPDYIADNYGQETYLAHVTANSPELAVRAAQTRAFTDNPEYADNGDLPDFYPLAVFAGQLEDLKP